MTNSNTIKSQYYWKKAQDIIINGVQTLSKSPEYIAPESCPVYIEKAKGAYLWDVDGNKILDFPMALGPVVLGYAYHELDEVVKKQLDKGVIYSLSSPLEIELAELICSIIPSAEKVKFLKSGSDATSAAIRIARAYTGKNIILACGYHGWHDWTIARTSRNAGVPLANRNHIIEFPYNDLPALEKLFETYHNQIAAVIMEPVGIIEPEDNYLQLLKQITHKNNALLIFDEIITGFRLHLGGGQGFFSVTPDLSTFGKAIANGYPLAVVVGNKNIIADVEDDIFISSTFAGDTLAIVAAITTIKILIEKQVIQSLSNTGIQLKTGLNELFIKHQINARCHGLFHKTYIIFEQHGQFTADLLGNFFRSECLKRGCFLGYGHFTSFSHTDDDIKKALYVADEVLELLKVKINTNQLEHFSECKIAKPVFRKP